MLACSGRAGPASADDPALWGWVGPVEDTSSPCGCLAPGAGPPGSRVQIQSCPSSGQPRLKGIPMRPAHPSLLLASLLPGRPGCGPDPGRRVRRPARHRRGPPGRRCRPRLRCHHPGYRRGRLPPAALVPVADRLRPPRRRLSDGGPAGEAGLPDAVRAQVGSPPAAVQRLSAGFRPARAADRARPDQPRCRCAPCSTPWWR